MAVKLKKKRLLSIIIKNESIKIAELSKNAKNITVHKVINIETPKGAVNDGMIEDMTALARALKTALELNGITSRDVVFSLVSSRIATKEVVLPDVKDNKLGEIVMTNASEYFPVDIDQYIVKYTVLERFTEGEEKKVKAEVVAAPVALVDVYYQLAAAMEIRIETIDYLGNSTYQILKQQITDEFSVVINIDNESTVVSIFDNNALKMQRTIPYGKAVIVNAVMDEYGIDNEREALAKLQEEKLLHISFDGDELTENLSYLVSSINRIIDYYISRNGSRHFERAYIVGNATTIAGFVTLLSNELSMGLTSIDTLQNVVLEQSDSHVEKYITSYVANIGALVAPLGLTEKTDAEKEGTKNTIRTLLIALAASAIVGILITVIPLIEMLSVEGEVDDVKKHITELSKVNEIVDEYYTAKDMLKDVNAFAAMTGNSDDYLHNFIAVLEKKIPSDVSFASMSVTSGAVTISGKASSKSSVAKLIQQLQTIETVENVYVSSETETKDNTGVITVSFSLTCTFDEVTEAADGGADLEITEKSEKSAE